MLLALDIGNTNLVCGLFSGSELVQTFRMETVRTRTTDEQAAILSQLLNLRGIDPASITSSILASVVPPVTDSVADAVEVVVGHRPLVVGGPGLKTGIRIRYDNPREVGADRIVNAVAAHARVKGPVVVVDFGTATTFDCISEEGDYLGGVIVPGIQVSLDGLLVRAAKLSRIELKEPPSVIGKNTVHAMQSGVIFGYAALVDGLLEKIAAEMGGSIQALATGGLAPKVSQHTRRIDEICPSLTLDGLRLIQEKNRGADS